MDSHCSCLIRLTPDKMKLFSSHVTWSGFSTMLRIYKTYKIAFHEPSTKANGVSFSSFPGNLPSGDDFYVTNTNLVVMETTNGVMNASLFRNVTEQTVPFWIRVVVANRMASNGDEWTTFFSLYNSGTYNNQWMVVDNKLFTPGKDLPAGTLWIAEQIPGYVVRGDVTSVVNQQGSWVSYNVPYFPFVYNISGYPAYYKKYGDDFSYSQCARAKIFRRDAPKVQTLQDMKNIMRYNQWQTDPLSLDDACKGISARCDLNSPQKTNTMNPYSAFGGIDAKITSNEISGSLQAWAVNGPTWDSQPPFAWTKEWDSVPHFGQPKVFDFDFVTIKPLTE